MSLPPVGDESSESVLYLDTPQGEMQLKLDAVNSISNCKVFVAHPFVLTD